MNAENVKVGYIFHNNSPECKDLTYEIIHITKTAIFMDIRSNGEIEHQGHCLTKTEWNQWASVYLYIPTKLHKALA